MDVRRKLYNEKFPVEIVKISDDRNSFANIIQQVKLVQEDHRRVKSKFLS